MTTQLIRRTRLRLTLFFFFFRHDAPRVSMTAGGGIFSRAKNHHYSSSALYRFNYKRSFDSNLNIKKDLCGKRGPPSRGKKKKWPKDLPSLPPSSFPIHYCQWKFSAHGGIILHYQCRIRKITSVTAKNHNCFPLILISETRGNTTRC